MKKLSNKQAVEIFAKANQQVLDNPTYRLGQALYNLLPEHMRVEYDKVKVDDFWYQTTSKNSAVFHFWNVFVE